MRLHLWVLPLLSTIAVVNSCTPSDWPTNLATDDSNNISDVLITLDQPADDKVQSGSCDAYLVVEVTDDTISIKKNETNFNNFDENETDSILTRRVLCSLTCSDSTDRPQTILTVTDINNYAPEWSTNTDITLPMPYPATLDILQNAGIKTTDKDFSNTEMTYEITDPVALKYFTPSFTKIANTKDYTLVLTTNTLVSLVDTLEFEVKATDNGTPTKSSTVTLKITPDQDNSVKNKPSFKLSSYVYNYNSANKEIVLETSEDVFVETDHPDDVQLSVAPNTINCEKTTSDDIGVTVKCTYTGTEDLDGTNLYTVTATTADSSTTTLIVKSSSTGDGPQFEKGLYEGTYNQDTGKVEIDSLKTKNPATSITLSDETNFKMVKDGEDWTVEVVEKPSDEMLHETQLNLEMTATDSSNIHGRATLIINLPGLVTSFNARSYAAVYSSDNKLDVQDTITINNNLAGVTVQVNAQYDKYIKVAIKDDQVEVTKGEDFSEDMLLNAFVAIEINLKNGDSTVDSSVLNVALPSTGDAPEFEEIYYEGTYDQSTEKVTLTKNPSTKTPATISLVDETYFKMVQEDNVWSVQTVKPLEDKLLHDQKMVIGLTATGTGNSVSSTSLVINLPGLVTSFDARSYSASYSSDNQLTVQDTIKISNNLEEVTVEVEDQYSKYIKVAINDDQVEVTKGDDFSDAILVNSFVAIVISLKNGDTIVDASVLNVALPASGDGPDFVEIYYEGTYDQTTEKVTLTKNPSTKTPATISLADETYFKMVQEDNVWNIQTVKPLEQKLLHDWKMVIGMTAKDSDNSISATSLIINLPGLVTKFDKSSYSASYSSDGKFSVKDTITIENNLADAVEVDPQYTKYFEAKTNNDKVVVSKLSDLSDAILKNTFISVSLSLKTSDEVTDTCVLNVELPESGNDDDDDSSDDKDKKLTAYLAVLIVLAILLVLVIIAFGYIYYRKMRYRVYYANQ